MTRVRELHARVPGQATSDGAGVKITRFIGSQYLNMLDPFLLMDVFASDDPDDYIAGFPPHPHRGFTTLTYMLAGKMRHKDNMGNEGVIETGGIQWMDAARGVTHSELPEQQQGLMKGMQIWLNLPSSLKMSAPSYQEVSAQNIPSESSHDYAVKLPGSPNAVLAAQLKTLQFSQQYSTSG